MPSEGSRLVDSGPLGSCLANGFGSLPIFHAFLLFLIKNNTAKKIMIDIVESNPIRINMEKPTIQKIKSTNREFFFIVFLPFICKVSFLA